MDTLWHDIRYAARSLARTPAFALVVVLTLAVGIGANTAVFSAVNGFILRSLPLPNPEQLTVIAITHEGNLDPHPLSYLDFLDYRKSADIFSGMAGYLIGSVGLSDGQQAERATVCFVTSNYFSMLGVEPSRQAPGSRLIQPGEGDAPGAAPVLVLGHSYWQKRFGGDPSIVGQTVRINAQAFTVIGVVPATFHGTYALAEFDAYLPIGMATLDPYYKEFFVRRDLHFVRVIARLNPGATRSQAEARLAVIARQLDQQYPATNKAVTVRVYPENLARPEPSGAAQNPLVATLFLSLTALVLLVACINVANLLLVRATLRQKEIALRAALGAGQMRLVRQLLTESVLLALAGGVAGALLGLWVSRLLESARLPGSLPFRLDFALDWRVFAFTAAIAVVVGLLVGLLPALRASRINLNQTLREGGRALSAGAGPRRVGARNVLVVSQVAVSLVLLVAAGLFVRSLGNAQSVDLGFDPRGVLNLSMDPSQMGYDEARTRNFYHDLAQRVRALPGVELAALAHSSPMGYYSLGEYTHIEGREVPPDAARHAAAYNVISPGYLQLMRIPLLSGRAFTEADNASSRPVAILNEFMAKEFWPQGDAIGKRFSLSGPQGPFIEIVGITGNGKYRWILEDPDCYFFLPIEQSFKSLRVLHLRASGSVPPTSLALAVQKEVRALEPNLPVSDVMTMEQGLEGGNGFFLIRMGALIGAVLGALGLVLAIVGVYGVVSYTASQRTHEIGVRLALGAQRSHILKLVVGQGLLLVSVGVVLGLALSFALSRFMGNLLFGISAQDPITFAAVALLLASIGLIACWIPAQRATRVDPMIALHYE
ncbi:MAG: ABC transporter permease [Candidatus Acidiferrales bacterium]